MGVAGAWLLLQVFGELRDNFGWSPLFGRVLTVVLAVGFLAQRARVEREGGVSGERFLR